MKTKSFVLVLTLSLALVCYPASAGETGPLTVVADTVVVRPLCLAATAVGSAFFLVSLPFAALSHSVKKTAHTLVVRPAQATFTRPLGDMDALVSDD